MNPAYKQDWYYDEQSGEIRDSNTEAPIDFFGDDECGRLAAAAPELFRALLAVEDSGAVSGYPELAEAVGKALQAAEQPR